MSKAGPAIQHPSGVAANVGCLGHLSGVKPGEQGREAAGRVLGAGLALLPLLRVSLPLSAGLGGGSASGKTTVARMIIEALDVPWVVLLSMDSFYKVRSTPAHAGHIRRGPGCPAPVPGMVRRAHRAPSASSHRC